MRIHSLIIVFTLVLCRVHSQQTDCDCVAEDDYSAKLQATLMGFEYFNPIEGYKGKHYFNSWTQGEVELDNGDVIKNIYLQYDQFQDELLWLRRTDRRTGILPREAVAGFRLFDSGDVMMATFVKRKVDLPFQGHHYAYLQLLAKGGLTLYVFRKSTAKASANQLVEKSTYFISGNGKDYLLRLSRKSLLNIPAVDHVAMKTVLHDSRLTINNNEEGLIQAIQRYNQIIP